MTKPIGRPGLINDTINTPQGPTTRSQAIINAVRNHRPLTLAAPYGQVSKSVVFKWKQRGEQAQHTLEQTGTISETERPYLQFVEDLAAAESEAAGIAIDAWTEWLPRDWRAASTYLARRHHKEYSDKLAVDLTVQDPDQEPASERLRKAMDQILKHEIEQETE
jgi:hypothetical protein